MSFFTAKVWGEEPLNESAGWGPNTRKECCSNASNQRVLQQIPIFLQCCGRKLKATRAGTAEEVAVHCLIHFLTYLTCSAMQKYGSYDRTPKRSHNEPPKTQLWNTLRDGESA